MPFPPNIIDAPLTQAEPAQWHVYRALCLYAKDHPEESKGLYFCNKLHEAHTAYVNTFVAG